MPVTLLALGFTQNAVLSFYSAPVKVMEVFIRNCFPLVIEPQ